MSEIMEFFDWSPFFWVWELKGSFPKILDNAKWGEQARELYKDAQRLLADIVKNQIFNPTAVVGIWPANSNGDDVDLYIGEKGKNVKTTTFHFLRQQGKRSDDQAY